MQRRLLHNVQVLDEFSAKNGWGSPIYQLHSTIGRDGSGDLQLFLFKVRSGLHGIGLRKYPNVLPY